MVPYGTIFEGAVTKGLKKSKCLRLAKKNASLVLTVHHLLFSIDVLSLAGDPTEMMVTWVTLAYTNYSIVEYNKAGFPLTLRASGGITKFTDGGSEHRVLYIHRVKLTGLVPGQRYGMYSERTH